MLQSTTVPVLTRMQIFVGTLLTGLVSSVIANRVSIPQFVFVAITIGIVTAIMIAPLMCFLLRGRPRATGLVAIPTLVFCFLARDISIQYAYIGSVLILCLTAIGTSLVTPRRFATGCTECGYSLDKAMTVCPECGVTIDGKVKGKRCRRLVGTAILVMSGALSLVTLIQAQNQSRQTVTRDVLVRRLGSLDMNVAAEAQHKLAEDSIEVLEECLHSPDALTRARAVQAIGWSRDERKVTLIEQVLLHDDDETVRIRAVDALALGNSVAAQEVLKRVSEADQKTSVRDRARRHLR